MARPARPSLVVEGALDHGEWLELYRATLRLSAFWPRLATTAGLAFLTAGAASALGAPVGWAFAGGASALGMLAVFTTCYVWLGPWLRFGRIRAEDRTARWRIDAERLRTETGGVPLELAWQDVDQVRVTRRLLTFELTEGRGLLALPRRTATDLGEALILGWAGEASSGATRS